MKVVKSHLIIPCEGELVSGDAVVWRVEGERALLGVVDVLGHGPRAAKVAGEIVHWLHEAGLERAVEDLVLALHEHLRGERGAAALICRLQAGQIEACSVGNVELRGVDQRVPLLLTPGILGIGRLPRLRVLRAPLVGSSRLVSFTDGVSPRMLERDLCAGSPEETCRVVLDAHRRKHDDATVVVLDVEEN